MPFTQRTDNAPTHRTGHTRRKSQTPTQGGRATRLHKVDGPCPPHIGRATHGGRARRLQGGLGHMHSHRRATHQQTKNRPHADTRWTGHTPSHRRWATRLHMLDEPHTEDGPCTYTGEDGPHAYTRWIGPHTITRWRGHALQTEEEPHASTWKTGNTRKMGHMPPHGRRATLSHRGWTTPTQRGRVTWLHMCRHVNSVSVA